MKRFLIAILILCSPIVAFGDEYSFSWSYEKDPDYFTLYNNQPEGMEKVEQINGNKRTTTVDIEPYDCNNFYLTASIGEVESQVSGVVVQCGEIETPDYTGRPETIIEGSFKLIVK